MVYKENKEIKTMELQKLLKLIKLLDELSEYGEFDKLTTNFDIESFTDGLVEITKEKEVLL
jgi:hypothetical protein